MAFKISRKGAKYRKGRKENAEDAKRPLYVTYVLLNEAKIAIYKKT